MDSAGFACPCRRLLTNFRVLPRSSRVAVISGFALFQDRSGAPSSLNRDCSESRGCWKEFCESRSFQQHNPSALNLRPGAPVVYGLAQVDSRSLLCLPLLMRSGFQTTDPMADEFVRRDSPEAVRRSRTTRQNKMPDQRTLKCWFHSQLPST